MTALDASDPYSGYKSQHGYYTDHESGLLLLSHRSYDPLLGRWLTRDPIGYEGGINLYAYVDNNPVNLSDPLGLAPDDDELSDAEIGSMRGMHPGMKKGTAQNKKAQSMLDGLISQLKWSLFDVVTAGGGHFIGALRMGSRGGASGVLSKVPAIRFRGPAAKSFNWEHIFDHHADWGVVARQRMAARGRGTFFTGLNADQIKARVTAAWKNRKVLETQWDSAQNLWRQRLRGTDPVSGETMEFWFNKSARVVETAYPIR